MNRRNFLKSAAALAVGTALPAVARSAPVSPLFAGELGRWGGVGIVRSLAPDQAEANRLWSRALFAAARQGGKTSLTSSLIRSGVIVLHQESAPDLRAPA